MGKLKGLPMSPLTHQWHVLLEDHVARRGGQGAVAAALCEKLGRTEARDFEASRKNLANWISGRALPQPRNFRVLTGLLAIAEGPGLAEWNEAYRQARARLETTSAIGAQEPHPRSPRSWQATAALMLLCAIMASTALYYVLPSDAETRSIGYLPFAELKVGESVLVHAKRGQCGKAPPEWSQILHEIPNLKTGRLVDDGLGISQSTTCGGETPGRLVRFIAETPGEEEFDLFQRRLKVVVKPAQP